MHRRLFLAVSLLLISVLLISCKEGPGSKIDPKTLADTVGEAMKRADALDALNLKAYEIGQVGASMAATGVSGSEAVLEQALTLAKQAHAEENKKFLADLKATTSSWTGSDMEQVAPAIDRIDKAVSRTWVIRSIADGISISNSGRAKVILAEAATEAENIADPKYRDLDLRSIAAKLGEMGDSEGGVGVAGKIKDARVKAWALLEVGKSASGETASKILGSAAETAATIASMDPKSELLSDETPAEAKDSVLGAEKSRLAAYGAKTLSAVAAAMNKVNPAASADLFAKAETAATGIDAKHAYTRAYAMSDVAFNMAESNPTAALALADKIEKAHSDAKFAVCMKVARVNAAKAGVMNAADLNRAKDAAKDISDRFNKEKALSEIALAMAPIDAESAVKMAESDIASEDLKNEILASAVVTISKTGSDQEISDAIKKIVEPEAGKEAVLYSKSKMFSEMGDMKLATDAAAAKKLYGKASGAAAAAKSSVMQWKMASKLCAIDPDALFSLAVKIDTNDAARSAGLAEIAAGCAGKDASRSAMVFDLAAKSASSVDDKAKSCELLKAVAAKCAASDKAKAAAIFNQAIEKANKIGIVEG